MLSSASVKAVNVCMCIYLYERFHSPQVSSLQIPACCRSCKWCALLVCSALINVELVLQAHYPKRVQR